MSGVPTPFAAPGGGGGGGGGELPPLTGGFGGEGFGFDEFGPPAPPEPIVWSVGYNVAGAPSWWQGMIPSRLEPDAEYALLVNALIPFMSPEDQRAAASNLARLVPDAFGGYATATGALPPPPSRAPGAPEREQYLSTNRAQQVISTLESVRNAMGKTEKDFGPGYTFLRDVANVMKSYGGRGTAPTRQQYLSQISALDPLLAETKGEALAAYGPAARMLTQPFFSGGPLVNVARDQFGRYRFGTPNVKLF